MGDDNRLMVPLWTRNFITVTIVHFLLFFGFQMLLPTLPLFADSLGADESTIGLVTGIFTISAIVIRPIAGVLVDKVGRRIIFVLGMLIFIFSTFSYIIISSIGLLLVSRFIHGFGWGASSTANDTIATDNIPKERFGEGMGYFSLSSSLAMAIGPAIGLFITSNYNFNVLFYSSAIFSILSLLLSTTIKHKDLVKEDKKKKSPLGFFEKTSINPSIMMALLSITYGTVVSFLSIYAERRGVENIGLFFTVYALSLLLSRPVFGKIIDKYGFDYTIIPGMILVFISMLLLSFANSLIFFLFIALIYGIGFGACQSSLQTMAIIDAPAQRRGAANASFFTGFDFGIGIGAIIYGYFASTFSYSTMYFLAIIPVIIALILYFAIGRKK